MMRDLLKQVKQEKISQGIVNQIRNLIENGKMKLGDKLPPERELARIFRVSRASVREAMRALEAIGLVSIRVGNGTYVKANSIENLIEPLAIAMAEGRESLIEIFAVRKMIEPEIAYLAAQRATPDEILQLREIVNHQRQNIDKGTPFTERDYSFHWFLVQICRSTVFTRIYAAMGDLIDQTREEFIQEPHRGQISIEGHEKILSAVEKRDPELAKKTMHSHLKNVEREALRARRKE